MLCNDRLMEAVASCAFLTILARVSEITNGLITRIRRMPFLLQMLLASHRRPKEQEMKLPIVQLIRWEGGRILPSTTP